MPEEKAGNTSTDTFMDKTSELDYLNGKRTFDEFQDISLTAARRSQVHFDDISQRTTASFDQLLQLQAKINEEHFASIHELRKNLADIEADRRRHADDANYVTRYDLSNPVTTGAGDALRSAAYTPNRATDTASAGVGVSAEAVAAAVAKEVDASLTPLLGTLQQTVQALAAATASIANVMSQAQPKTA